jgi:hypothetical protein
MSSAELYQASPIKRRRRTRAQVEQLDNQIIEVLASDHPQSVRHCFYRMTDPRLPEPVEKSDRGYNQVQDRITRLRRGGRLPYGWISDTSRRGHFVNTYDDAQDFLMRVKSLYRADLWCQAEVRCEVWVESRSIAGVVQDDCEELAVSLYPCGGFPSITFAYQAAEYLNAVDDRRPVVVIYIGDYDPAGVLIDEALQRELREHLDPHIELDFRRIAITAEQIAEYDLPTKPRKPGEKRATHIEKTVEAEAMRAGIMRQLLRSTIEELLPLGALAAAKVAEESERHHLDILAELAGGAK